MPFQSALAAFDHQLARRPVAQYWNPGLAEGVAQARLTAAGLVPTLELLALYAWKNGQAYADVPGGKLCFGAHGAFYPLEMSLQEYALSQQERFYASHFFPVFHDDTLLLNLDPHSPQHGCVCLWSPSLLVLSPEPMYDSLPQMFATFAACFTQGIYGYDADGYFDYDSDAEWALSKALNPHARYWHAAEDEKS